MNTKAKLKCPTVRAPTIQVQTFEAELDKEKKSILVLHHKVEKLGSQSQQDAQALEQLEADNSELSSTIKALRDMNNKIEQELVVAKKREAALNKFSELLFNTRRRPFERDRALEEMASYIRSNFGSVVQRCQA